MFRGRFQHHSGPIDVGPLKVVGFLFASSDVRFGREVGDEVRPDVGHCGSHGRGVGHVAAHESIAAIRLEISEARGAARIGESVEIEYFAAILKQPGPNKMAPQEAGTTGNHHPK
jgi:hypothetical protein